MHICHSRFSRYWVDNRSRESIIAYRHIQIAAVLCNDVQQRALVSLVIAGPVITFGVCSALFIRTPSTSENLYFLVVMGIVCVDDVPLLISCLRGLAKVLEESKCPLQQIQSCLLTLPERKKRKWTRRFLKSCGVIKMKFGGNNFAEMLTPLNCVSQATQISVQILLLRTKH